MQYNQQIKYMFWNAQGINSFSKKIQLEQIIKAKYIDVLFLCETFLKEEQRFSLSGYKIYRCDRPTHGGGVAIAVRNYLKTKQLPNYPTCGIENVSVELSLHNRTIVLTSVYSPRYTDNFKHDIAKLTPVNKEYIVCGDLNAKHSSWNCSRANTSGNILYNMQLRSNFFIHYPSSPTRFPQSSQGSPTTIDLMITNSDLYISPLLTHDAVLPSDHSPVTFSMEAHTGDNNIYKLDFKNINWELYQRDIERLLCNMNVNHFTSTSHIESALERFIGIINTAKAAMPRKKYVPFGLKLSNQSKLCIKMRNKYKRLYQRASNMNIKTTFSSIVKQLNKLIELNISKDRNDQWQSLLAKLPKGSKKFWRISKSFNGKKINRITSLQQNGHIFYSDDDKVRLIADQFEKAHRLTENMTHSIERKVSKVIKDLEAGEIVDIDPQDFVTTEEVKQHIKSLKNNKAPGFDGVLNIFLKKLPEKAIVLLKNIFNASFKFGFFPACFKCAKVVAIHKQGKDPRSPSSYRPISLLSSIDKLYEKIILSRLNAFIENNNLINKEQFGFRNQHSTVHQIKRMTNLIKRNKRQRLSTGVILLDIEKAFDSIWHNGLIYKLKKYGFPLHIVKIIKSFLTDRAFKVVINNSTSSPRNITAGVPQGAVLSPTLYSLYVADFDPKMGSEIALYADDMAIMVKGKLSNAIVHKLEKSLGKCAKFYKKWKIRINTDKTQAILFPFNKSRKRNPSIPLRHENKNIPFDNSVKYLGVYLDKKLIFKKHIENATDKAMKCFRALYPLISKRSKLNVDNKLAVYKTVIRPVMLYGCCVWGKAANSHTKKLQVLQNRILKTIFNLPRLYRTRELHIRYAQQTIKDVIDVQNIAFNNKCRNSDYDLIRSLSEDTF